MKLSCVGMETDARRIEAVALSLALGQARLRAVLLDRGGAGDGGGEDGGDQRRHLDLARADARLRDPPAAGQAAARACRAAAVRQLAAAAAGGIEAVTWRDVRYPVRLAAIDDPPAVIWVQGDPAALGRPAVAVVGSRAASPCAVLVAERLGADLGAAGMTVVSGLARGVDAAAHRGALAAAGVTVAVLGSGVDVIYPAGHAALAAAVAEQGALVSELGPGTPPRPRHFPRRNRLISGLALGVVIVEAGVRSGSLITARCAADQGREVMAVPGNVLGGRSAGTHALIRDGAALVESAADVLEQLGLAPAGTAPAGTARGGTARGGMAPAGMASGGTASGGTASGGTASGVTVPDAAAASADAVLRLMAQGEVWTLEDLIAQSGLDSAAVLARLTDLEVAGLVGRVGAGRFVRSGG